MKKLTLAIALISLVPAASGFDLESFFADEIAEAVESFKAIEESMEKMAHSMNKKMKIAFDTASTPWSYDIQEKDDSVLLKLRAPGIDAQAFKPEIDGNVFRALIKANDYTMNIAVDQSMVHISTKREFIQETTKDDKKESAKQTRIATESFADSIPTIIINEVQVELDNDHLTITFPKKFKRVKKEVPVAIKNKPESSATK